MKAWINEFLLFLLFHALLINENHYLLLSVLTWQEKTSLMMTSFWLYVSEYLVMVIHLYAFILIPNLKCKATYSLYRRNKQGLERLETFFCHSQFFIGVFIHWVTCSGIPQTLCVSASLSASHNGLQSIGPSRLCRNCFVDWFNFTVSQRLNWRECIYNFFPTYNNISSITRVLQKTWIILLNWECKTIHDI